MANMIRNISQTVQEREIVKTSPDIVVYLDGLPYLLNYFVNDANSGNAYTLVNFNDHVTAFNAGYDTDLMIPSANIGLQVPNYSRSLYQMPGGNNLVQTMMQVQVYAKAYYMSATGDTVYRRVFKGIVSHVGYNDNGKTLEISIQCYGSLYMLELMQINLSPSLLTAAHTGSAPTYLSTKLAYDNPYRQIADAFVYGLSTDGFQLNNLTQSSVADKKNQFFDSVNRGYISKWQAILSNLSKDVHIFGATWKDNPTKAVAKESEVKGTANKDELASSQAHYSPTNESDDSNDVYFNNIREYLPDRTIADVSLLNNQIVSRMELIRKMVHMIDFEGYQDVDGKIIVKPPLYNLDVLNLGQRTKQTSTNPLGTGDKNNSLSNPLTSIYPENNPFVVHLAEILTEQETEDQAAIRRTRTVVSGNVDKQFSVGMPEDLLTAVEWIDVSKLQKFGLREEPAIYTPWFKNSDKVTLFAHAVAETVRANRGYRTYTFTIPMRPELKLGFPVFIPHRDMYGYIKSIQINYQIAGTATMTVMCDSLRRRVLINTPQKDANGKEYFAYTNAPNLIYKWANRPPAGTVTQPDPAQSPGNNLSFFQNYYQQLAQGGSKPSGQPTNLSNPVGAPASLPSTQDIQPSKQQWMLNTNRTQRTATVWGSQADTNTSNYVVQNDGNKSAGTSSSLPGGGLFTSKRRVDYQYLVDVRNGNIPFTDDKGYEVISPFPWGRWKDLNSAIKEFTEAGWVPGLTDINGAPIQSLQDLQVLQNVDAFMFAGLGTPTATGHASDQLLSALTKVQNRVGGNQLAGGDQSNILQPDATVIVLSYSSGQSNDNTLLDAAQPENTLIAQQIANTQNANQRLVDVLVSGSVAPTKASQEALLSTQTQTPTRNITLNPEP